VNISNEITILLEFVADSAQSFNRILSAKILYHCQNLLHITEAKQYK